MFLKKKNKLTTTMACPGLLVHVATSCRAANTPGKMQDIMLTTAVSNAGSAI